MAPFRILSAGSLEDLVGAALSRVRDLLPCERASIVLGVAPDEGVVFRVDLKGETHLAGGARIPLDQAGEIMDLLRAGEPFVVQDLLQHPELPSTYRVLASEGLRSYVSSPMVPEGELVGSLNVASTEPGAFRREHLEVAAELADQLAIAIAQARLRDSEREHASQLEELVGELRRTDRQRRVLLSRLVRAQEEERGRIAGDIHDDTIQAITAVGMRLATLRRKADDPPRGRPWPGSRRPCPAPSKGSGASCSSFALRPWTAPGACGPPSGRSWSGSRRRPGSPSPSGTGWWRSPPSRPGPSATASPRRRWRT